jgi:hypothetical protein
VFLPQTELGMLNAFVFASVLMSASPSPGQSAGVFTLTEFAQLKFLAGRWKGTGPDGKDFYEEYDFPAADAFRSRRYPDATFSTSTDSSTVSFDNGDVISRWGEFSWKATEISADKACFSPVNAPSSFCWQRSGAGVEVIQRWKGDDGKEQSYTLKLTRVADEPV